MLVQSPRGLGDVHHEVGTALQLVGDTERGSDEPEIHAFELTATEQREAFVLDRVPEAVDGVVVVDHTLGRDEVTVYESFGARRDRIRGERRQPHDAKRQVTKPRRPLPCLHNPHHRRVWPRLAATLWSVSLLFTFWQRCSYG